MKNDRFNLGILVFILMFAIVGAFAVSMTTFLLRDENMYISASVFVAQGGELYKDFSYLQMPYLPLLFGGLYQILGIESYYLFAGRLINWLFLLIASITLFLLARRILSDHLLALGITTLFLLNIIIISSAGFATNFMAPVTFSLISFYLFYISFLEDRPKFLGITAAGIFLALAIGTRLTYATTVIPFAAIIIYYLAKKHSDTNVKKRMIMSLVFYAAGLTAGLLPVLLFMSDLGAFMFNNLGFHRVNTDWRQMTDFEGPMSLYSKISFAHKQYLKSDNLILLLGIMCGYGVAIRNSQSVKHIFQQIPSGAYLAFILACITAITALLPTPSWQHYYAIPVSFLFILLIFSFASDSENTLILRKRLLMIFVLMMAASNGPHIYWHISRLTHEDAWTGIKVHSISMNVRNILIQNGISTQHKIATLSPVYAMEANLPIYSELSTGPFLYRIGDLLTAEQRKSFVGTSATNLRNLFTNDPPAAILIGDEGDTIDLLKKPFIEYAVANNYRKVPIAGFSGEFYIMP